MVDQNDLQTLDSENITFVLLLIDCNICFQNQAHRTALDRLIVSMAGAKYRNNYYTYGTVMKFDNLIDFAIMNHMRGSAKLNFHFPSNSY